MTRVSVCPMCNNTHIEKELDLKDHFLSQEDFELLHCTSCNFRFTSPIPEEDKIGAYYASSEYISHSNTSKGLVNKLYHYSRQYMLKRKKSVVDKWHKGQKRLLDIGCGTGYFLNFMQSQGYTCTGIERDQSAANIGRTSFNLNILEDQELFNLENKAYDVVSMWHVLEHVHDFNQYLEKIHALLADDGVAMIALPNCQSTDAQILKEYWAAYDVPRHLWHFTPDTLEKAVEKHGFKLSAKVRLPLDSFYVSMLSCKYRKNALAPLRGAWIGFRSFMASNWNVDKSSSILYICEKK